MFKDIMINTITQLKPQQSNCLMGTIDIQRQFVETLPNTTLNQNIQLSVVILCLFVIGDLFIQLSNSRKNNNILNNYKALNNYVN